MLGIGGAVPTPETVELTVDPTNPSVDYLASDVSSGAGTGLASFFTSFLGILAEILLALCWFRRRRIRPVGP